MRRSWQLKKQKKGVKKMKTKEDDFSMSEEMRAAIFKYMYSYYSRELSEKIKAGIKRSKERKAAALKQEGEADKPY